MLRALHFYRDWPISHVFGLIRIEKVVVRKVVEIEEVDEDLVTGSRKISIYTRNINIFEGRYLLSNFEQIRSIYSINFCILSKYQYPKYAGICIRKHKSMPFRVLAYL